MAQVAVDTVGGSGKAVVERDPSRGKFEFDNVIKDGAAAAWDAVKRDFGTVTKDVADAWNTQVAEPWRENVAKPFMEFVDSANQWCTDRINDAVDVGHGALNVAKGIGRDVADAWKSFGDRRTKDFNEGFEESRSRRNGIATPVVQEPGVDGPEMC